MDEYFCPNCGATLNYQPGFDPSRGEWTCTECGQQLMDDDTYDGDTFEGVAWHCDNCGALLNRQYGFSDSYGTWTCTECGRINGTTEDDIIEGTHFTCPECGSTLNNQFCFNQYSDDWECTSCGAKLHHSYHDDEYSVVEDKFSCPNCGDTLDDQWCFADYLNDWTCTRCGAHLHHSYSDDEYTVVDDDPFEVADTEDDGAEDAYGYTYETSHIPPQYQSSETSNKKTAKQPRKAKKQPESELRKKRLKAFFFHRKKVEIGYDPSDLLRRSIEYVQTALQNKAFTNIRAIPVKDIYTDSPYQVGEVEQIVIGGSAFFEKENNIPYDTEIIITFHEKKEITIPYSAHSLRKKNYITVGDELQSLGFTEIYERPIKDLITGWVKKDGSIEKVSVGGNSDFKKNSPYKYDTKIVIEYHTFKKKN